MTFATSKSSFYFVRHGQTDWNMQHKLMGQKDIVLNEKGRGEAEHAAYILKSLEIDKIYSSDLKRASETANIIANICELDVEEMKDLRERSMGEAEGETQKHFEMKSFISELSKYKNAETYKNFKTRILNSVNKIVLSEHMYPLIVSHGGVFRCLAKLLANEEGITCANGEVFCFTPSVINEGSWDILPLERWL